MRKQDTRSKSNCQKLKSISFFPRYTLIEKKSVVTPQKSIHLFIHINYIYV